MASELERRLERPKLHQQLETLREDTKAREKHMGENTMLEKLKQVIATKSPEEVKEMWDAAGRDTQGDNSPRVIDFLENHPLLKK